ncbi:MULTISPECIES: Hint domain-containing protein [Actibacterium]|uniref:Hedgehog/Intein (Hint) domain-containing protein n=1 Tax=Actibacterium naphthalenivorans TaxID=1614693 RepID=A0A840CAY3_9RHOB|nr:MULTISPECIES: Hint domain-containing protein [Actibacterium]ALG90139.1 hypothetical protein TQ29_08030 [Actibacterium sp. EMB200-NS6]MBB4022023.1 hypothetical protein [Actibacterium naphthalenivorans]
MFHSTDGRARRGGTGRDPFGSVGGLAQGSIVLTLDGALPVEFLNKGDRIITRSGARVLRGLAARTLAGAPFRIRPGALGHDHPCETLLVAPGQRVLVRDWRARALYDAEQALVPVEHLADGTHIATAREMCGLRVWSLIFDDEQVFYADGIEVGSAARVAVPA